MSRTPIEKVAKEVAELPKQIAAVPTQSYRLSIDARKEFDKLHAVRADVERLVFLVERDVEAVVSVLEKTVVGYEEW